MKKISYIILIMVLLIGAFSSVFLAWGGEVFPRVTKMAESQRFTDELGNSNVSAWFSGHIHARHNSEDVRVDKDGVAFINNGSIYKYPESLFLIFENGKRKVTVKSRDHSKRKWNENLENRFSFYLNENFEYKEENLVVWSFCDVQPNNERDWEVFENTIKDVNSLNIEPDMAIAIGDLVDDGAKDDLERFKDYCENTEIPWENFYPLTGNHDFNPYFAGDLNNYKEIIRDEINYTVKRGNTNFIFMSDIGAGVTGHIDDNVFEWWKDLVKDKENNNLSYTHQPLVGTTQNSVTTVRWMTSSARFLAIVMPNVILIFIGLFVAIGTAFRKN